jgi:hypothetical protein
MVLSGQTSHPSISGKTQQKHDLIFRGHPGRCDVRHRWCDRLERALHVRVVAHRVLDRLGDVA